MRPASQSRALALPLLLALCACSGRERSAGRVPVRSRDPVPAPRSLDEVIEQSGASAGREAGSPPGRPPGPRAAALRALVLRTLTEVERFPREGERTAPAILQHFESEREAIVHWLEREGAWEAASAREREALSAPAGTRREGESPPPGGAREPLLVMLWALGLVEPMPGYDVPAPEVAELARRLPAVGAPASEFLRRSRLRPREEIDAARDAAEWWHWRARARESMDAQRYPQGRELDEQVRDLEEKARAEGLTPGPIRDGETFFRELIRFAAHTAHGQGLIPPPVGDDFPVLKKSYRDLSARRFALLQAVARQRHHSLNWLSGHGPDWDAVPTDT